MNGCQSVSQENVAREFAVFRQTIMLKLQRLHLNNEKYKKALSEQLANAKVAGNTEYGNREILTLARA